MLRARFWPTKPSDSEMDGIESRFPPGTRSGEGSHSLHVFLEAARKTRLSAGVPAVVRQRRGERNPDE